MTLIQRFTSIPSDLTTHSNDAYIQGSVFYLRNFLSSFITLCITFHSLPILRCDLFCQQSSKKGDIVEAIFALLCFRDCWQKQVWTDLFASACRGTQQKTKNLWPTHQPRTTMETAYMVRSFSLPTRSAAGSRVDDDVLCAAWVRECCVRPCGVRVSVACCMHACMHGLTPSHWHVHISNFLCSLHMMILPLFPNTSVRSKSLPLFPNTKYLSFYRFQQVTRYGAKWVKWA